MSENWINDNFCSLADDTVRVERGPQIVELDCNDDNLDDSVTHSNYRVGGRDAFGKVIMPERCVGPIDETMGVAKEGDKMHVVDWRSRHAPYMWKIYTLQETDELDSDGKPISRFIKVNEIEGKDEALEYARGLV